MFQIKSVILIVTPCIPLLTTDLHRLQDGLQGVQMFACSGLLL